MFDEKRTRAASILIVLLHLDLLFEVFSLITTIGMINV